PSPDDRPLPAGALLRHQPGGRHGLHGLHGRHLMASVTSWVRLEPRSRDRDLAAGAEARLHDPLWLVARQWQLGQLRGLDGGSALLARARLSVERVDAVRAGGPWVALSPDASPVEVVLDDAPATVERAARTGRQLQKMLAPMPGAADVFLSRFPLVRP